MSERHHGRLILLLVLRPLPKGATGEILKTKSILARIGDVTSIINGEYAENEVRKDFTPSERVGIAKAIERKVANRHGQTADKELVGKTPQLEPRKKP